MIENLKSAINNEIEFVVLSSAPDNVIKQHEVKSSDYSCLLRNCNEIVKTINAADLFVLRGGGYLFDSTGSYFGITEELISRHFLTPIKRRHSIKSLQSNGILGYKRYRRPKHFSILGVVLSYSGTVR